MTRLENGSIIIGKQKTDFSIIRAMLQCSYDGCTKTSFTLASGLDFNSMIIRLDFLLDKKLISNGHKIEKRSSTRSGYKITEKGKVVLSTLIKLEELIN